MNLINKLFAQTALVPKPPEIVGPVEFRPNGKRQMYEEEFLQAVIDAGVPLQVKFVLDCKPVSTQAEEYFRGRRFLTFHMSYDEEEGWFVYAEQLPGVLFYADTISESLYVLDDALNGHAEAVLDENGSKDGQPAQISGLLDQID